MEAASAPRPSAVRIRKPRRLLAALSDERLVEHIRKGEPAAFEVLYDRHSAGVLGFCRHMLGSATDAEDAVQQAFMAAHADIQRHGQRDLHVKAWLYTIARNRCLSMLRARREHPADDAIEIASDRFSDDVQQREDLRVLLADVAKLPEDQREALVLAEVGDLSHTEISRVIGCEASKVKSLVFQARTALIDRRVARETPCEEIREQIASLRGGALRRSHIRHHLDGCPGCAEFRDQVRRQRALLAVALPVVPSAALRAKVLGSLGIGGGSAAAGGGGGGLALAVQGGAAKLGVAAVLVAAGGGAATLTVTHTRLPIFGHASEVRATDSSAGAGHTTSGTAHPVGASNAAAAAATAAAGSSSRSAAGKHHRSASGSAHGFTPARGGSNGAAARQFALTRGQGKHAGITKTHHSASSRSHRNTALAHTRHVARTHVTPVPRAAPKATPKPAPAPARPKTQTAPSAPTTPTTTTTAPAPTNTGTTATPAPSGGHAGKTSGSGMTTLPGSG